MNSIVTVSGVSFEFPNGRELFQNLNFTLENQISALVGPNGIGKSTLAKILAGEIEPTSGSVRRSRDLVYFPQRVEPEGIPVSHYLADGYTWSSVGESLIHDVDRDALCTMLSGGEWRRVRLARTLNDSYLILDEPTNDLDRVARNQLIQFLSQRTGGALLISHDRELLKLCADIFELSNRGLAKFGGGWQSYMDQKNHERENLNRNLDLARRHRDQAHEKREIQKARQEKRNRRGRDKAARGGIPKILSGKRKRSAQATSGQVDAATLEQAKLAVQNLHEALIELKVDPVMYASLMGSEIPTQKLVAEAKNFNVCFQKWLYPRDLNFTWRGNIRLALKGRNGSGKTTLLKGILGERFHDTKGSLRSGGLVTLYIDQRCGLLNDEKSIFENVQDSATLTESEIRNGLASFLFTKESVFQKVRDLSGGERLRAALAKGFISHERPEVLVLDEPTNNLDLVNTEFLETLVAEFRGAIVAISHDEVFLRNCRVTEEFSVDGED